MTKCLSASRNQTPKHKKDWMRKLQAKFAISHHQKWNIYIFFLWNSLSLNAILYHAAMSSKGTIRPLNSTSAATKQDKRFYVIIAFEINTQINSASKVSHKRKKSCKWFSCGPSWLTVEVHSSPLCPATCWHGCQKETLVAKPESHWEPNSVPARHYCQSQRKLKCTRQTLLWISEEMQPTQLWQFWEGDSSNMATVSHGTDRKSTCMGYIMLSLPYTTKQCI